MKNNSVSKTLYPALIILPGFMLFMFFKDFNPLWLILTLAISVIGSLINFKLIIPERLLKKLIDIVNKEGKYSTDLNAHYYTVYYNGVTIKMAYSNDNIIFSTDRKILEYSIYEISKIKIFRKTITLTLFRSYIWGNTKIRIKCDDQEFLRCIANLSSHVNAPKSKNIVDFAINHPHISPILLAIISVLASWLIVGEIKMHVIILFVASICYYFGVIFNYYRSLKALPKATNKQQKYELYQTVRKRNKTYLFASLTIVLVIFALITTMHFIPSASPSCGHEACEENGPFPCAGKNNTCPNYTKCCYDLYCDECD